MVRYRGQLFHNLRRSMARKRNEGIAKEVIMTVGGWRTSTVFKRYSNVNPNDTAHAVRRVGERLCRAGGQHQRNSRRHLAGQLYGL